MLVTIRGEEKAQPPGLPTFLAGAFRPFFLLGATYAVAALLVWVASYTGVFAFASRWPVWWWHGHEMVFGFATAAIAGFLLTAVPKWTGTTALRGAPLGLLVLAWLVGRVAAWPPLGLPEPALLAADQLFLVPLLAWTGRQVFGTGNRRNYAVPVLIASLAVADAAFHWQMMGRFTAARPLGLYAATYVVVVLTTLISGRIVPAFTASALSRASDPTPVITRSGLGQAAVAGAALTLGLEIASLDSRIVGGASLATATLLVARSAGWRAWRSRFDPLVWILHLGHAWLIVGFALLAVVRLAELPSGAAAFHAFGAGAIGTLVLAVTSRASLGHSGRPLRVSRGLVVAYLLVTVGALLRVATGLFALEPVATWIGVSGLLWALAFAVFVVLYWPILTRPRVDGRPG